MSHKEDIQVHWTVYTSFDSSQDSLHTHLYFIAFGSRVTKIYLQVSLYCVRIYNYCMLYITTWLYFQSIRRRYASYSDILYLVRFLGQLSTILSLLRGIWSRIGTLIINFLFKRSLRSRLNLGEGRACSCLR